MSHERRTPVTVLRSSLEALCDGVIQEPKEVAEYHDSIAELRDLSSHNPAVKKYPLSFYRKWVRIVIHPFQLNY